MKPAQDIKLMASQMIQAAESAHGYLSMPMSGIAFDFCQQVEYEEPGTYPLFADCDPETRMAAMRRYARYTLRRTR